VYRILLLFFISILLSGSLLATSGLPSSQAPELYFFNPDCALSNLGRLKQEMETFFDRSNYPVNFQAFSYQTDFDAKINKALPKFLFVPEWYVKKYGLQLKIRPFLVPSLKGETTYRKVLLIAKNSSVILDSIETLSLAMTSAGPDSEHFLSQVLFSIRCKEACRFRPVIVPKSTDALFALFLGQVDSALVVQEHLANMEKMLPRIIDGVRPLKLSKPIPMPMLCYSEKLAAKEDIEEFKTVFLNKQNEMLQKKILELLHIDGWQEIEK
jgi:hypothetical protein